MDLNNVEQRIQELEKRKAELIEQIRKLNRRLRYKQYEQKALEPYIEKTKGIHIGPLRRKKNAIEFRISPQAYTPRLEREWLKEVRKLEEQLKEVKDIEWARRKLRLVQGDITECETQITAVEPELQKIRGELKQLYEDVKTQRAVAKRAFQSEPGEDFVTLGDIGIIEQANK
jgi:uncharacterized coiled-coil DUF342 family protein